MKTSETTIYRKSQAAHFATKYFGVPELIVTEYFDSYFLLYWEGSHILRLTTEGNIESPDLTRGTIKYRIVYHNITRGQILANPDRQYALSFRIPKAKFNLPAYVLIGKAEKK